MGTIYIKYNPETGQNERPPVNDTQGTLTGKLIIGVENYFNENPEVWKELGYKQVNIEDKPAYDPLTHYLSFYDTDNGDGTITRAWKIMERTEEMLAFDAAMSGHAIYEAFRAFY